METLIAYCGLNCAECGAYKATVSNDEELRRKTGEEWRKMFSPEIKDEDLVCLGCKSDTVFGYCRTCEIRTCSSGKSIENCAGCESYECEKITGFFSSAPNAKETLDKIRNK